jgi:hypothetical protein
MEQTSWTIQELWEVTPMQPSFKIKMKSNLPANKLKRFQKENKEYLKLYIEN